MLGPVGLAGDLRVQVLTDFPERFAQLRVVHVGDNLRPYAVQRARLEGDAAVLHLAGVDDAASSRALANQDVQIPIDDAVSLPPDQYFWHEIVGLDVWTDAGRHLGRVTEVLRTGSNDVYVVQGPTGELLIPAIEDVVQQIDPASRRMIVHLLPGMEES